jgi:hypothetical protein
MDYRCVRPGPVTLALAALAVACGGGSPTSPSGGGGNQVTVTSVTITGSVALSEGATSQLTAMANKSDGSTDNVSSQATWQSSDATVATVSGTGLVTALKTGNADVTAAFGSQTGRRTVQVSPARYRLSLNVQSVTALATCDDVTQGLTNGEFAARVLSITADGERVTLAETREYPGDPGDLRVYNLADGASRSIDASRTYTLNGEAGQSVRVQFNATEWDEQIVIIPPSIRWIHDNRLDDATISRTHSYANGTFSSLGPNTLTLGNSSCGIRLNYSITAERQ